MANIFPVLSGITVLFFVLLAVKELFNHKFKERFCVICAAVTFTWIFLLVLYWLRIFENQIIIALLIGQTTIGIFYLAEKELKDVFKLFRLPFLLTLIVIAHSLLAVPDDIIKSILFLSVVWLIFILIYVYKNNGKINYLLKKLIECCKNW
jgi:CDP-diglyceride synthetase